MEGVNVYCANCGLPIDGVAFCTSCGSPVANAKTSVESTDKDDGPVAATTSESLADELAKLVALRDSGVLTEEEFANAKTRLLASSSKVAPTRPSVPPPSPTVKRARAIPAGAVVSRSTRKSSIIGAVGVDGTCPTAVGTAVITWPGLVGSSATVNVTVGPYWMVNAQGHVDYYEGASTSGTVTLENP